MLIPRTSVLPPRAAWRAIVLCLLPLTACNRTPDASNAPVTTPASASASASTSAEQSIEMIFWEHQSWKPGGGSQRLTLWADGRSQARVVPMGHLTTDSAQARRYRARAPWKQAPEPILTFVREDVFTSDQARDKFRRAIAAGIAELEQFEADFVDGSGTLVGAQRAGQTTERTLPYFSEARQGSRNHRRFVAVSKVLDGFDVEAFEYTE